MGVAAVSRLADPRAASRRLTSAAVLQESIDRAAHFNMFSIPEDGAGGPLTGGRDGTVIGFRVSEMLHRFRITTLAPKAEAPLRAGNVIGERAARSSHRWMLAPDDFVALPGREPPPTALAPSRSQRFVMLDSVCTFGDGEDGFRGFGTGQTFPGTENGQPQLRAAAVGTVLEGFGKFRGIEEGTYVYCGTLSPERGFMGNLLLRVIDRQGVLRTENPFHLIDEQPSPESSTTYLLLRGQAAPDNAVNVQRGPDGRPSGLIVEQGIRLLDLDFKAGGRSGLQSTDRPGRTVGKITAHVTFDLNAPGGSIDDPIPFMAYDEFEFFDERNQPAGSFTATSSEGRVFHTEMNGEPGIRFGGIGRILAGTGHFREIGGLMTDNSVVVFTPHVSASVYVLRVHDPRGRFSGAAAIG